MHTILLGLTLLGAPQALTQTPAPAPQARPNPCDAPEFRHFDFWLGEWEVKGPAGSVLGSNTIEPIAGNCGLHENWSGALGGAGHSVNTYQRADGKWHQAWVGSGGGLLLLSGGLEGKSMVLTGTAPGTGGTPIMHRITWTPIATGGLRQVWESSTDGGTTWSVGFDGTYSKKR